MIKQTLKLNTESFFYRITEIYIYAMLFLFPLFTGFQGYAQVTLSKYIFFVSITCLWLISLCVGTIKNKNKFGASKLTLAGIFILIYFVFCLISSVFSPFKASVLLGEGRFDGLITIFLCVGIFIGISLFSRPKRLYIYASSAAVLLCCAVAVLQLLGYNPLHLFPGNYNFYDAGTKFSSTFLGTIGNADLFSAYICLMLPLLSVYYITAKKRPLSLLPSILLAGFCLFVCGVSGGILALAVTAIAVAPFIITNGGRLKQSLEIAFLLLIAVFFAVTLNTAEGSTGVTVNFRFSRFSALLLIIAVLAAVMWLILRKREFEEKTLRLFFASFSAVLVVAGLLTAYYWNGSEGTVYELSQIMHGNFKDSFGSSRILIWRKIFALIPDHTLLGGGPGTLPLRLDIDFSRYVPETGKTLSTSVDNAHNVYLGILVNTGLLSLVSYLAAQCVSLFKAAKSKKLAEFSCCLACCLLCYWIQSFFGLGLFLVSPIMWLIWGLLIASLRSNRANTVTSEPADA